LVERAVMRQTWRRVLAKVAPYDAGKSLDELAKELGLETIVRLSANESPLGPSPRAVEALRREAARAHLYPDGGSGALRAALAERLGVAAGWGSASHGAGELLMLLAPAADDPGGHVGTRHP